MRAFRRTKVAVALAGALGSLLPAVGHTAEIRVLSIEAVQTAVHNIAGDFAKDSGHRVVLTVAAPAAVMQKIKDGEVFDAIIVAESVMDQLDKDGIVNPESRERLAVAGLAVAIRDGSPAPGLATPDAFKQALIAAKSIVYDDPKLVDQSGARVEQLLAKAGMLDALRPRTRVAPSPLAGLQLVASGQAELGIYDRNEIAEGKGVRVAGVVPPPLQINTAYEGAMLTDGAEPQATRELLRFLASPDGRPHWSAAKLEPLSDH